MFGAMPFPKIVSFAFITLVEGIVIYGLKIFSQNVLLVKPKSRGEFRYQLTYKKLDFSPLLHIFTLYNVLIIILEQALQILANKLTVYIF